MLRNYIYYGIKPLLPTSVRLGVRRWFAHRKRDRVLGSWPIMPGSEKAPLNWSGWPEGKQFALVLTHDVEGAEGLKKCRQVMELEMELGFRSCFNFVPQGEYRVSGEFREELVRNGFEVGVHDLYHDGKLFLKRSAFARNAVQINRYLKDWKAVGFRSGFMLRELNWIHDLEVLYDASTFDTDPFEPQPDGAGTIFPFWVPRTSRGTNGAPKGLNGERVVSTRKGYVELPYTLPQDSTVFLLLRERHPDIWMQKSDWIAKHGGMVLLDSHPDYMDLGEGSKNSWKYPIEHYRRFLEYIRHKYEGRYWPVLPREVAQWVRSSALAEVSTSHSARPRVAASPRPKPKIWIDLDNTPHVPFFEPIMEELQARGFPLLVTARDAFQVIDLAKKKQIPHLKVGRHYGKNRLMKGLGLVFRGLQLAPAVRREQPALAVSHGARSQLLLSNWLRVPTILIEDYEYCQFPPLMRPHWVFAPSVIPDFSLGLEQSRIRKYPGIKEDVYAWKLKPDPQILRDLGLSESDLVATVRPPATEAHYHNPESEHLFDAFVERALQTPEVKLVLLPRNEKQSEAIRARHPSWFQTGRIVIPHAAVDGMNLIWHSDLVVSGGGTMNREAAALRVPVYSIFRGSIGAVDTYLQEQGRLVLIESIEDVQRKIALVRRPRKAMAEVTNKKTLHHIVSSLEEIACEIVQRG